MMFRSFASVMCAVSVLGAAAAVATNANDKKGGLAVDSYATLMAGGSSGAVVEGGAPDASYLWQLVNHESEPKMPPNADKLPEPELAIIKKWIEGGVLETSGSTAKIKKQMAVAKIEVSTERPADVAMPQKYLGDSKLVTAHTNAVTALATSPWAPLAAVSSFKQIAIYNTATLELLGVLPFPEGQAEILKFSRNGSLLMAGGGRGGASGKVVLFDVKTGDRMAEVGDEYDVVLAADVSPDHSQVALGGPKKMLRVYNVSTGELMYETKKHTDWVTAIEFSPDGVLLASGDRANGLVVWEAFTGRPFQDLLGHQAAVTDVSWRPDSNVLASSSEDGTIRLWEMNNGSQIKAWNAHGGVAAMDYTRDGRFVSTGRDRIVRLWNGDGAQEREFGGMTDLGMEVAYDAESNRVLGGDWSGVVRVWNAADGALLGQFDTNPPTISLQLEKLQPQLVAIEAQSQQAAVQLAAMMTQRAELQAAAATAAAAADAAAQKAAKTAAARAETDKLFAEKSAIKATADKTLVDSQAGQQAAQKVLDEKNVALKAAEAAAMAASGVEAATKEQAAAAAVVATAEGGAKVATDTAVAAQTAAETVQAAEQAAVDEAAKLKAAAEAAAAAAKPTPEQDQALAAAQAAATAAQQQLEALRAMITRLQSAVTTEQTAAK
ncbi:MAG: c-type cytochrome domain-containing protein [Planctomycetaceae bacterium]